MRVEAPHTSATRCADLAEPVEVRPSWTFDRLCHTRVPTSPPLKPASIAVFVSRPGPFLRPEPTGRGPSQPQLRLSAHGRRYWNPRSTALGDSGDVGRPRPHLPSPCRLPPEPPPECSPVNHSLIHSWRVCAIPRSPSVARIPFDLPNTRRLAECAGEGPRSAAAVSAQNGKFILVPAVAF